MTIDKDQIAELETLRARLAELEKQKPVATVDSPYIAETDMDLPIGTKLFAAPVVSHDVEKLIEERDELLSALDAIADAFGVGEDARKQLFVIVENAKNSARRSQCLSLIEAKLFTFEVEDEDGENVEDCMLNWGDDPDEYAARFGEAMSVIANAKCEEIKTELEAARKDAEWISVENNLPGSQGLDSEEVLCFINGHCEMTDFENRNGGAWGIRLGYYDAEKSAFRVHGRPEYHVTHWKPLPAPPAIEQAKGGVK